MITRTKKILILAAIPILLALMGMGISHHSKKQAVSVTATTLVKLSPVQTADIPQTTAAVGTLSAHQQTEISPKVGGYISKILFQEGDFVAANTVLIQLDDTKEKNDLAAAKADAALSQQQYEHDLAAYKKRLILQDQLYNTKVVNEKNQAIVQSDTTALADMALIAPFSGYVGSKNINLGDYVNPGQKLVTLVDQKSLTVNYTLPGQLAPQLKIGQAVTLTADNMPHKIFHAVVTFISPIIDANSQTIAVHAVLDNTQDELKPGQFVHVTQTVGAISQAILVPESSVLATINGYYVFTVKNNHAVVTAVKIGEQVMGNTRIISGLTAQDRIITTGQNQIKNNDLVTVVTK